MTVAEDAFLDFDGYMLEPIDEECRPHQLLGALQTWFFQCRFASQLHNEICSEVCHFHDARAQAEK